MRHIQHTAEEAVREVLSWNNRISRAARLVVPIRFMLNSVKAGTFLSIYLTSQSMVGLFYPFNLNLSDSYINFCRLDKLCFTLIFLTGSGANG
jgi:hypothetical protein